MQSCPNFTFSPHWQLELARTFSLPEAKRPNTIAPFASLFFSSLKLGKEKEKEAAIFFTLHRLSDKGGSSLCYLVPLTDICAVQL